jgi:hypothetical protein
MSQFNSVLDNFLQIKDFYEKNPNKKNATLYRKALLNIRSQVGVERKAVLEKSKPNTDEKTTDEKTTDEKTETKTEPVKVVKPRTRKPKAETVEVVSDPTVTPEKPKRRNNKKPVVDSENKTA